MAAIAVIVVPRRTGTLASTGAVADYAVSEFAAWPRPPRWRHHH